MKHSVFFYQAGQFVAQILSIPGFRGSCPLQEATVKLILTLFALILSTSAYAETEVPCSSNDYRTLYLILGPDSTVTFNRGASRYRTELYSVLQQEMGPKCVTFVEGRPRIGISGDHTRKYDITDAVAKYSVVYRTSVERRRNDVSISRRMLKK